MAHRIDGKIVVCGIDASILNHGISLATLSRGNLDKWRVSDMQTLTVKIDDSGYPVMSEAIDCNRGVYTTYCLRLAKYTRMSHEILKPLTAVIEKPGITHAIVCIEGFAYASWHKSHSMGEAGGVFRNDLATMLKVNAPRPTSLVVEVPPSCMKKFVTGSGSASKIRVATTIAKKWQYSARTDHESDAYALMRMAMGFFDPDFFCHRNDERVVIQTMITNHPQIERYRSNELLKRFQ